MHFYASIPRFILGVTVFILALIPALKDAVGMYRATKQWQSNKYLKQLMRDGIFYFLMYVSLVPLPFISIHVIHILSSIHIKTNQSYPLNL
jgi:hypothetical protein